MEYHILDKNKKVVASFEKEKDRDDCLEHIFFAFYDDCKWYKAKFKK